MFTHLHIIHSSVNKKNQNKTRKCQLIFVNDFKFDSQILECESSRKAYIAYTNWRVNRMMQGKERTTIHLDLLQVGLTSLLVNGASFLGCEVAERATKSGEVYKSAFFESLLFIVFKTNSPRQSTHLLVEYAFWNSCPRLKRKIQAKAMSRCILHGTAQVCFWIVVYTTKCYKNSILVSNRKKISGLPTGKWMPQCFCCSR